ncbi:hypothetical protein AUR04nite_33910 [Glutamicibacter uratoxydans]|uniref:Uncharacterized protein n=1 Tax=Glutamicibacter uratoxydans TaxID=43667 RepID=A0A4Y4DRA3_GLUUR|nr:hypothetical protein AUR04nite_33910 [Glutamicibacter uratoxydans]
MLVIFLRIIFDQLIISNFGEVYQFRFSINFASKIAASKKWQMLLLYIVARSSSGDNQSIMRSSVSDSFRLFGRAAELVMITCFETDYSND